MIVLVTRYNPLLVLLSVIVAIFASYVALDLANSVTRAQGRLQNLWLGFGALAMGFGIWSMHFVGMLAFDISGIAMSYDVPLMGLSIVIAIAASALALYIVSRPVVPVGSVVSGGVAMAAAIAGMHYTGMYSMRMPAVIHWNIYLVSLSILIALIASFGALLIAIRLRKVFQQWHQALASVIMGVAISGMHYTGMMAATFVYAENLATDESNLLATSGLAISVLVVTAVILGLALGGSVIDRAFSRRARKIEESTRLYKNAEKAVVDLQEERELRDRFVSALAHDLRTPLTAAKMSAQLSIRQATQPEQVEKHSGKIIETIQRMDQMIQDLLDAHRISAGQALPLQIELCNLNSFLQETLEDLTTVYGDRFVLKCQENLQGYLDCKYLRRAVENLCTNAVKYGKEGTPVLVKAETTSPQKLLLSVNNKGAVIPRDEQQNLFALFHRGRSAEMEGKGGWGLGLMIVKGVAEAHGGKVWLESSATNGNTFFIEIPMKANRA